jgi:hypothetical protein
MPRGTGDGGLEPSITNFQGDPVPLINVRLIENACTTEQKRSVHAEQPKPGGRPAERGR